jgi:phosphohistidine phosphatase
MPHTLFLIRHAHAEAGSVYLPDHDRDLLPAGIMAAARTGRYLHEHTPDGIGLIMSSTAHRAFQTAKVVAEQTGIDADLIVTHAAVFDQGPKAYLAAVKALPETVNNAVLVGHNPDISYFAEFLTHNAIGSLDKGDLVAIELSDGLTWAGASQGNARLRWQWSPNQ